MYTLHFDLKGDREISAALDRLGATISRSAARKALRAGLNVILPVARANAPRGKYPWPSQAARRSPGTLRRNIVVRSKRSGKNSVALMLGIDKGLYRGEAWYAPFVEFGHRHGPRTPAKGGAGYGKTGEKSDRRKFVQGRHFLKRAYESTKAQAIAAIRNVFLTEIEKEIK